MRRVCLALQVRPECRAEPRRRHAAVWSDMLAALRDAGWRDYSLFLGADGLLLGYFQTDDLGAFAEAMEAAEVNAGRQAETAPVFADLPGGRPDRGFVVHDEVFNLDDQLGGQT